MSALANIDLVTADLVAALSAEHVVTSEAVRAQHATGESYHRAGLPDVVVYPGSTGDLAGPECLDRP